MDRRRFITTTLASGAAIKLAGAAQGNYRACIIGSTDRGGYGHSMEKVFAHRPDVQVVALADPNPQGAKKAAAASGATKTYASYREMLDTEKPDLVSIGPRWTTEHLDMVRTSANVGAHIYMEKPVAASLHEVDQMVAAVEAKDVRCAVAHQMRLAPAIQALKKEIDSGILGNIMELRGRGKEDHRSGGEDLIVLGVHIMDLMLFFAGAKPNWCSARILNGRRDIRVDDATRGTEPVGLIAGDTVHAVYAFDTMMGYFDSHKNAENGGNRWGLDIYGTKGAASIRLGAGDLLVQTLHDGQWAPDSRKKYNPRWTPLKGFENPDDPRKGAIYLNALAIDDLIESVERYVEPQLSIQSARDGLEMVQAAYQAALSQGRVRFPLEKRSHPLAG